MADATSIKLGAIQHPEIVTKTLRFQLFEAIVTTNETIPLEIGALTDCACFEAATGLEVTATVATTIVTVTEAGLVDDKVIGIAFGTV